MKKFLGFAFLLLCSLSISAQTVPVGFDLSNFGVRIEPDKRVMAVLATLELARTTDAAGNSIPLINTPLSAEGAKFRELLNSDNAAVPADLRDRITSFVTRYKRSRPNISDAELLSPFISMAFTLSPAPDLADPVVTSDLPGSLLDVLDFAPLVRDFYRRSNFSANQNEYTKTYLRVADDKLRSSSREMVSELLVYMQTRPQLVFREQIKTETQRSGSKKTTLTQVETRERERRFVIVPEMLAPAGTVNFVNVKDDYYVIVPPDTDVSFSEVRRAYLQFVVDPLVIGNSKDIAVIRDSVKTLIDDRKKAGGTVSPDVYLTISRSLVAAIDTKQIENERVQIATAQARQRIAQMKTDDERRAVSRDLELAKQNFADESALRYSEDYEKGAILVFYFSEQLAGTEEAGFDISASMREMILSFDAAKEAGRYDRYADARKRALAARTAGQSPAASVIVENPVTKRLREIEGLVGEKNYKQAESDLKTLLNANPGEARIFYNLGRVASLSAVDIADEEQQKAKLLEAKIAYENVIRTAQGKPVDAALVSLSYVAIGKIYEYYDDRSTAVGVYDAAIRIGDVPGGAFKEALAAKQRLLKDMQ
ncbi:MAG: hypothetical protein QUS14_15680 [Pyrinomonadaceae bacterium]|nr:hypothetical protein [Pyrinomonadaceae bacterium]